jgi:uncharacterized protein YecT (DUF1311 family)
LSPFALSPAVSAASLPSKLKPPVISEPFTKSPCNQKTTVGMEGCQENQILRADQRIDREVSLLFTLLRDDAARERLIRVQQTWLAFRKADCLSQSDVAEGGTAAGIYASVCYVNDDSARSQDLEGFYEDLTQGNDHPAKFP